MDFGLSITQSSLMNVYLSISMSSRMGIWLINISNSNSSVLYTRWMLLIRRVDIAHPSSRYCSSVGTHWSLNDFSISHSGVLEWLLYNIKFVTCRDLDLEHFSPNRFIQLQASSKFFWGMIFLIFFQIESLGLILF